LGSDKIVSFDFNFDMSTVKSAPIAQSNSAPTTTNEPTLKIKQRPKLVTNSDNKDEEICDDWEQLDQQVESFFGLKIFKN
jgi:hypothetical protein